MAINYTQDISPDRLNTSRNNTVIKFNTDLVGTPVRAELIFEGETYKVTPNPSGVFSFNFIEAATRKVNTNDYCDTLEPDLTTSFIYNESGYYLNSDIDITIVMDGGATDTDTKSLRFKKAVRNRDEVKQIDTEPIFEILLPLINGEYYANYYEGFPFDFSAYYRNSSLSLNVNNLTNSDSQNIMLTEGVNRVFIENGGAELFGLSLDYGNNRIEFNVAGVPNPFYLNIFKSIQECDYIIKWFNHQGGWSYYSFTHKREVLDSDNRDLWNRDHNNIDLVEQPLQSVGYDTQKQIRLTSRRITEEQIKNLESLIDSPKVYRWCEGEWLATLIEGAGITPCSTNRKTFELQVTLTENQNTYKL